MQEYLVQQGVKKFKKYGFREALVKKSAKDLPR
jgi:hypothetical protein